MAKVKTAEKENKELKNDVKKAEAESITKDINRLNSTSVFSSHINF